MMEEQTKGCVICLQNYSVCENVRFIPLSTTVVNNESYLNKIHYMAFDKELQVFQETWEICSDCSEALNKSYEFRKKLIIAVEFWKNWHSKTQMQDVARVGNSVSEAGTDGDFDRKYLNEVPAQQLSSEPTAKSDTLACEVCLRVFQRTPDMLLHICQTDEVRSPKLETFFCDLCDMNFTSEPDFKYHVKNVHMAPKVYTCTFCNKVFKHSYNMREHLTSHTGERNYTCKICNKAFHRLSSQTRHMQTHLAPPGEKTKKSPYLCSICGKSFPYSNGFQRHMRTHVAEKRHQCNICSRAFSQSTHLKVHMRTHSGEKPYMCCVCKASFSLRATLRKHMKGHKDSEDHVKMVHTLEPNLGQAKGS